MTNKTTNLGIIAMLAVLLIAVAFAGVASAWEEYPPADSVKLWVNESTDTGFHFHLNESKTVEEVKAIYKSNAKVYKITSLDDLASIGSGSDIYILTQDIYCTTPNTSAIINTFTGTLIGNGYTIYNLTINSALGYVGLVGRLGEHATLNYVNLTCAKISSGSIYVGGLVGYTATAGNITGCTVMHSDVTGRSTHTINLGGLVGSADSASLKIQNCSVDNSSVSASGDHVSGLVGTAYGAYISYCEVKNCAVSGSYDVGGLFGFAKDTRIQNCSVENSMVYAGGQDVGGLIGRAYDTEECTGCLVVNCTIAGGNYVGGLAGSVYKPPWGDLEFNRSTVKDSAVAGNVTPVGALSGRYSVTNASYNNVIVDRPSTDIQINVTRVGEANPGTYHMINSKLTPAVSSPLTFFKTLVPEESYGYAYKSYVNTSPDVYITSLGVYGKSDGFGYYPTYTVTYNGNGNESGSVPVDTTSLYYIPDAEVTVLGNIGNLAKPGYNFTGWNKNSLYGALKQPGETFPITETTVFYANWTANVTNVRYVNETDVELSGISPTLVTYNETVPSVSFTTPTRVGYTFAGWNISGTNIQLFNGTGVPQTFPPYINDTKYWINKSLVNGSTLTLKTDWRANMYNVTFNNTTGSGIMENQTLTYDVEESLKSNTFTKSGYRFVGWNKTYASGTIVDFADKASVKNLTAENNGAVTLYAVWTPAQDTPGSSKQTGYTVILPGTVDTSETMCTVNFTMNGHGIQVVNLSVSLGNTIDEPSPLPTADGYTFTGWYIDRGLTSPYVFSTPVTDNLNLYASWTAKEPKVPTSTSPAPFIGILAGLGAAAVLLSNRRK